MTTTETILAIILSSFLAIFLALAITIAILVIKLIKSIKAIVVKAEHVIDNVESATDVVKSASGPFAAIKVLKNIIDLVQKHK